MYKNGMDILYKWDEIVHWPEAIVLVGAIAHMDIRNCNWLSSVFYHRFQKIVILDTNIFLLRHWYSRGVEGEGVYWPMGQVVIECICTEHNECVHQLLVWYIGNGQKDGKERCEHSSLREEDYYGHYLSH